MTRWKGPLTGPGALSRALTTLAQDSLTITKKSKTGPASKPIKIPSNKDVGSMVQGSGNAGRSGQMSGGGIQEVGVCCFRRSPASATSKLLTLPAPAAVTKGRIEQKNSLDSFNIEHATSDMHMQYLGSLVHPWICHSLTPRRIIYSSAWLNVP